MESDVRATDGAGRADASRWTRDPVGVALPLLTTAVDTDGVPGAAGSPAGAEATAPTVLAAELDLAAEAIVAREVSLWLARADLRLSED